MAFKYLDLVNEITAPLVAMPIVSLGPPALSPLDKPLAEATVMVVSSAGVHLRSDPPFGFVDDLSYRKLAQDVPPESLRPCHPSPIRRPGRIDINVVHPYLRLAELSDQGVIGGVTEYHLSMLGAIKRLVPLVTELAPAMAAEAKRAGADLVMLVPLCPACHQAFGLLARVIESQGIPTVSVTGARDITERVRPPRAAFLNYPLGNSVGRPHNREEQRNICADVLRLVDDVSIPGEICDLKYEWPESDWESEMIERYWEDREAVISQRSHEFAPDGSHTAAAEVAAVEALL